MNFTQEDISYIESLGIDVTGVESQLKRFEKGFPDIELCDNVSSGSGLKILSQDQLTNYIQFYDTHSIHKKLLKFVPASGAASRMFKLLYNYLEDLSAAKNSDIELFFNKLSDFAFANELFETIAPEKLSDMVKNCDKTIVKQLLLNTGLNYGELPKALLSFHTYNNGHIKKAIDEHLLEGALYCSDKNNLVNLHFTVSNEHLSLIETYLKSAVKKYEQSYKKTFNISFSIQDIATNTIAVNLKNEPFRLEDGKLLFRPGGHGALLKNLNAIDADIIFIKNIDNVAAEWLLEDTITYKKALGGVLLETQGKLFDFCTHLTQQKTLDKVREQEMVNFLDKSLGYKVSPSFHQKNTEEKIHFLFNTLNRPLRVCGVVEAKNTGGGPFWVKHLDGTETLQLIETAQVNMDNTEQVGILEASNYANITDLVCGIKNYEGNKFDLMQFRDPDTGFIAEKSLGSKVLKAMELPGLWNGAMSNWNTVFVEVPMSTFNPVKTVLDLLKKEHQGMHE